MEQKDNLVALQVLEGCPDGVQESEVQDIGRVALTVFDMPGVAHEVDERGIRADGGGSDARISGTVDKDALPIHGLAA